MYVCMCVVCVASSLFNLMYNTGVNCDSKCSPSLIVHALCCVGLKKVMAPVGTGFGIFNGQHFVFRSSAISLLTKIRLLFRYGFSLFSVNCHVDDMLRRFSRIYSLQQHKGQTFYTVPDMLKAMGGSSFYHMTQVCTYVRTCNVCEAHAEIPFHV